MGPNGRRAVSIFGLSNERLFHLAHHLIKENMRHIGVHGGLELKLNIDVYDTGLRYIPEPLAELPRRQEVAEQSPVHTIRPNIGRTAQRHVGRVLFCQRRESYDQVALQEVRLRVVDVGSGAPRKKFFIVFHVRDH